MKKWLLIVSVLWIGWAFVVPENEEVTRKVRIQLFKWLQQYPQEKVYLHTDRDHYEAGDTLWFRAYLTNAQTHQSSRLSQFVYVELRNRQDSLYTRIKVPFRDSVFAGYIPLSSKMAQGDYFIRAYSYWMQNWGDDYIFRKKLKLLNPYSSRVQHTITWEKMDKEYLANIRFHNSRNEAYDKVTIDCIQNGKLKVLRTTDQGNIQIKLDSANFGKKMLIRFREGDPFEYEQTIYLPDPRQDFVVTYFPEGGELLAGCQQCIAIKVIGPDGLSREVAGRIFNERGEEVAYVHTVHKGMGAFELKVEPNQRYYGLFSMPNGEEKRFDLPESTLSGIGLKLITNKDMVGYIVMTTSDFPTSTPLYLLAHVRGMPFYCEPIHRNSKGKFLAKNLPEGILHFVILDNQYNVYSERLCFVTKEKQVNIELQSDKSTYHSREQVQMELQVHTDSILNGQGSFSVAVTDDEQVVQDSLQDHLLSYLLLTSDLKGHIEEPAFYFKDHRIMTLRYLDLLMMTQGWRRFQISEILQNRYDTLDYFLERGQTISGKVKNFWGKDASQANLILFSNIGLVKMVNADKEGYFIIDGITFPDSTKFMLQGRSKRGKKTVEVLVDEEQFLSPSVKIPFNPNITILEDDFYKRFSKDYYYENGEKIYILDEVIAKSKTTPKRYSFYDHIADYSLDSAKLASMRDWDMRMILHEFPGIEAYGDSIMRFGKKVLLLIDDFEEELERLLLMQPEDLLVIN